MNAVAVFSLSGLVGTLLFAGVSEAWYQYRITDLERHYGVAVVDGEVQWQNFDVMVAEAPPHSFASTTSVSPAGFSFNISAFSPGERIRVTAVNTRDHGVYPIWKPGLANHLRAIFGHGRKGDESNG